MDHGVRVSSVLAQAFSRRCGCLQPTATAAHDKAISLAASLGGFLSDAGWYADAEKVFVSSLQLCLMHSDTAHTQQAVECYSRLLHVRNGNCKYHLGADTFAEARACLLRLQQQLQQQQQQQQQQQNLQHQQHQELQHQQQHQHQDLQRQQQQDLQQQQHQQQDRQHQQQQDIQCQQQHHQQQDLQHQRQQDPQQQQDLQHQRQQDLQHQQQQDLQQQQQQHQQQDLQHQQQRHQQQDLQHQQHQDLQHQQQQDIQQQQHQQQDLQHQDLQHQQQDLQHQHPQDLQHQQQQHQHQDLQRQQQQDLQHQQHQDLQQQQNQQQDLQHQHHQVLHHQQQQHQHQDLQQQDLQHQQQQDLQQLQQQLQQQQLQQQQAAVLGGQQSILYGELCSLLFAKSHYDEAYRWCVCAVQELGPGVPVKVVVDVLRQASKACVVKREFKRAEQLIKHAVYLAREHFGLKHPKYSDALLDYGFYLLNVDNICQSVTVYQAALDIRQSVFGGNNIHVAIAHEDLAYSSYVHQYSSGKFDNALFHAERAIDIITRILPDDHLLLASSKRVKALILEEIAIDCHNKETESRLLQEAHELHLSSLHLAKKAFGEFNVQTAKHYGNLGRLYQSMRKYKEAEEMHVKAIQIKEQLLGDEDYEVALSVGHLASLYNYDMHLYSDAERLYLRSIAIGTHTHTYTQTHTDTH
uniref:Amyloid protein-binding protein 2 n=1 Tax=Petromyzon marinus TaxID=7757 RepID=A0AAJ7SMA9_PETMA